MGNVISGLMNVWSALPPVLKDEVRKKIPAEVQYAHQIVSSILNPPADEQKPTTEPDDDIIEAEWEETKGENK